MKKENENIQQYHLHKEQPEKLQFEIHDLSDYYQRNKDHASIPHSHSFYQILWFYKKGGKHFIDFNAHPILNNTVFFLTKNQIHYFEKSSNYEGILIHFNESFLMQSDVDIFLKYNVFNNLKEPCYCITSEVVSSAKNYIELMKSELLNRTKFGHQQVLRYLLKSLLIIFERAHRGEKTETLTFNNHYELHYLHFRELLEQNYNKGYSVKNYADKLNMSTKTLTTITNSRVSKTPSVLISERIILEAKRLLSFTTLHINEIGYKLGFEDASYFVKYFKRHTKNSPGAFRKVIS